MRIEIHTGNFDLTESLREHVERRIQFTLSWSQHRLQKVMVRLDDINGPKGGADKSCRIQIPVVGAKTIVIEEIQSNLYMAIDRAIERAGRALSRQLARKREYDHKRLVLALHEDVIATKSENVYTQSHWSHGEAANERTP